MPVRLLLMGLPLTILLGFGVGVLLVDTLSLFEVALLATLLAPTDAALGKAVVTSEAVPDEVRQGLGLTTLVALLLKFAKGQQWLTHTWIQVPVVALAPGCFAVAQFLGGSGFIAAFSEGLLFGFLAKQARDEFLIYLKFGNNLIVILRVTLSKPSRSEAG